MDTVRQSGAGKRQQQSRRQLAVVRIAVVDDDDHVRRLLRTVFEEAGYGVVEARNESELMRALKGGGIDLVTLDLNLRNEDGLAIARGVRTYSDVPIVMVTARGDDVDRIVGLEVGADDYIAKPFNVREVLARVRAVLRRTQARADNGPQSERDLVRFGGFVLDLAARELCTVAGRAVALTGAEFNLLEVFVGHAGRVLSREMLLELAVGTNAEPLERAIDTLVGRLRKKIETDPSAPSLIKTVRGAGYIFTAKQQRPAE
jgi:DNA-binding response OmpR family regulator